jgi:hypothetical protein
MPDFCIWKENILEKYWYIVLHCIPVIEIKSVSRLQASDTLKWDSNIMSFDINTSFPENYFVK